MRHTGRVTSLPPLSYLPLPALSYPPLPYCVRTRTHAHPHQLQLEPLSYEADIRRLTARAEALGTRWRFEAVDRCVPAPWSPWS